MKPSDRPRAWTHKSYKSQPARLRPSSWTSSATSWPTPGDLLLAVNGERPVVDGLIIGSTRTAAAYNLTVDDIHTFYVFTGNKVVLVHNTCKPEIGPYTSKGSGRDLRRSAMVGDDQWQFNTGHGFNRDHTGPGGVKNDLRTTTLTADQIEAAIVEDVYKYMADGGVVPRAGAAGFTGPMERYINVGGANIGYRVSQSPDGAFRVATYWNHSW